MNKTIASTKFISGSLVSMSRRCRRDTNQILFLLNCMKKINISNSNARKIKTQCFSEIKILIETWIGNHSGNILITIIEQNDQFNWSIHAQIHTYNYPQEKKTKYCIISGLSRTRFILQNNMLVHHLRKHIVYVRWYCIVAFYYITNTLLYIYLLRTGLYSGLTFWFLFSSVRNCFISSRSNNNNNSSNNEKIKMTMA